MRDALGSDRCSTRRASPFGVGAVLSLALFCTVGLLAQTKTVSTVTGTVVEVLWSRYGSQVRVTVDGKVYQLYVDCARSGHCSTEQQANDSIALDKLKPGEAVVITTLRPLNKAPGDVIPAVSIRPAPQGSTPRVVDRSAASPLDTRCTTITVEEASMVLGGAPDKITSEGGCEYSRQARSLVIADAVGAEPRSLADQRWLYGGVSKDEPAVAPQAFSAIFNFNNIEGVFVSLCAFKSGHLVCMLLKENQPQSAVNTEGELNRLRPIMRKALTRISTK